MEKQPLSDVISEALKKDILSGVLKPGERLMEIQYAEKLGVSRTPFREAIRKLELEGLVTVLPRRGAHVTVLSEKDIRDVLDIRRALDMLAVELFIENKDAEDVEELKKIEAEFEKATAKGNVEKQVETDVKFHEYIYSKSGNEMLMTLYNGFRDKLYRYRSLYLNEEGFSLLVSREHSKLIESIEKGNSARSKQIAEKHIANQKKNLTEE